MTEPATEASTAAAAVDPSVGAPPMRRTLSAAERAAKMRQKILERTDSRLKFVTGVTQALEPATTATTAPAATAPAAAADVSLPPPVVASSPTPASPTATAESVEPRADPTPAAALPASPTVTRRTNSTTNTATTPKPIANTAASTAPAAASAGAPDALALHFKRIRTEARVRAFTQLSILALALCLVARDVLHRVFTANAPRDGVYDAATCLTLGFVTLQFGIRYAAHVLFFRTAAPRRAPAAVVPDACDGPAKRRADDTSSDAAAALAAKTGVLPSLSEVDPNVEWLSGLLGGGNDSSNTLSLGKKRSKTVVAGGLDLALYAEALSTALSLVSRASELFDDYCLMMVAYILSTAVVTLTAVKA